MHSFISSTDAVAPRHTAGYCDPTGLTESNLRLATVQVWVRNDRLQQVFFSLFFFGKKNVAFFLTTSESGPERVRRVADIKLGLDEVRCSGNEGIINKARLGGADDRVGKAQHDNTQRLAGPLRTES